MYLGDFRLGDTFDFHFTTRRFSTGAPFTLAGTPVISAYPNNSLTQLTAGITLTVDFDSVTGLNHVRVVASSGNGYAAGNYSLVITTGTVDSVSVVGEVVATFSIESRSAVIPTTAGRTLTIESDGMAHADVKEVGGTAQTAGDIIGDTNDIQTKIGTPSDLGGGATLAANLSDIEAQTDDIGAAGAGLTAIPWNAAWDAEVQSEVDDALVAQRLDELINADSDIDGLAPPAVGSVIHELMSKTAGSFTFDQTTDSLEAIRDKETDIETDTQDIQSRLPAALVGGRMDSDVEAINNNTDAPDILDRSARCIVRGTIGAGSTITSLVASSLDPTSGVNDQFNGRIIIFDKDTTTVALRGQATDITDYVHATTTFTVTALTSAPVSGDTFTIQ